jgi:2-hydroxychromene-2-carboxylate isomerase
LYLSSQDKILHDKDSTEQSMIRSADWYFDFISPFSYLQFKSFQRLPDSLEVRLVPVLFAGLLNHWGQKGPAEIPAKRIEMYRYCHWYGDRFGIPFRTPPAHPFNPLKVLRLAIALGAKHPVVELIFDYIWGEGNVIHTKEGFSSLASRIQIADVDVLISSKKVKNALRHNTEQAVAAGVYGVPTFAIDGELFWGLDRTDMLLEYVKNPAMMQVSEMQRLTQVPKAAERNS